MPEGKQQHEIPNRRLPRVTSSSEPALAHMINRIAEVVENSPLNMQLEAGNGIKITSDHNTTVVGLSSPPSESLKWYPFKLYQKDAETDPLNIAVYYGTINGYVPVIEISGSKTAINDDLDEDTGVPYLKAGDEAGEYLIYLAFTPNDPCTTANEATATKPIIEITTDAEDAGLSELPDDTNVLGHVEIGRVTVEDLGEGEIGITKIHQSVTHSLMHESCGVSHFFWGV